MNAPVVGIYVYALQFTLHYALWLIQHECQILQNEVTVLKKDNNINDSFSTAIQTIWIRLL